MEFCQLILTCVFRVPNLPVWTSLLMGRRLETKFLHGCILWAADRVRMGTKAVSCLERRTSGPILRVFAFRGKMSPTYPRQRKKKKRAGIFMWRNKYYISEQFHAWNDSDTCGVQGDTNALLWTNLCKNRSGISFLGVSVTSCRCMKMRMDHRFLTSKNIIWVTSGRKSPQPVDLGWM